jgi:hypothetical protein
MAGWLTLAWLAPTHGLARGGAEGPETPAVPVPARTTVDTVSCGDVTDPDTPVVFQNHALMVFPPAESLEAVEIFVTDVGIYQGEPVDLVVRRWEGGACGEILYILPNLVPPQPPLWPAYTSWVVDLGIAVPDSHCVGIQLTWPSQLGFCVTGTTTGPQCLGVVDGVPIAEQGIATLGIRELVSSPPAPPGYGNLYAWQASGTRPSRVALRERGPDTPLVLLSARHGTAPALGLTGVDPMSGATRWHEWIFGDLDARALYWDEVAGRWIVGANQPETVWNGIRAEILSLVPPADLPGPPVPEWRRVIEVNAEVGKFLVTDVTRLWASMSPPIYVVCGNDEFSGTAFVALLSETGEVLMVQEIVSPGGAVRIVALADDVPDPAVGGFVASGDVTDENGVTSPWVAYVRPDGTFQWITALPAWEGEVSWHAVDVAVWDWGELPWNTILLGTDAAGVGAYVAVLGPGGELVTHGGFLVEEGFAPRTLGRHRQSEVVVGGLVPAPSPWNLTFAAAAGIDLSPMPQARWFRVLNRPGVATVTGVGSLGDAGLLLAGSDTGRPFLLGLDAEGANLSCELWEERAVGGGYQMDLAPGAPYVEIRQPSVDSWLLPAEYEVTEVAADSLCLAPADVASREQPAREERVRAWVEGGFLRLRLPSAEDWALEVYDVAGRRVLRDRVQGAAGRVDLAGLPGGIYFGRARAEEAIHTFRFFLLR